MENKTEQEIENNTLDLRKLILLGINEVVVLGPVSSSHNPSGFIIDIKGNKHPVFDLDTDVRAYSDTNVLYTEEALVDLKEQIAVNTKPEAREAYLSGEAEGSVVFGERPIINYLTSHEQGTESSDSILGAASEQSDSEINQGNVGGAVVVDSPSSDARTGEGDGLHESASGNSESTGQGVGSVESESGKPVSEEDLSDEELERQTRPADQTNTVRE